MDRLHLIQLDGSIYSCKSCHTHLANYDELMSKAFFCPDGKAYLFHTVVNVTVGRLEERMMITGMHVVADIFCSGCGRVVGWKYESAFEEKQKYKEGKFILERAKMVNGDGTDFYLDTYHTSSDAEDV